MNAMPPPVQSRRLTKRYGSLTAVDALDLSVRAGQVYGFRGPDGGVAQLQKALPGPNAGSLVAARGAGTDAPGVAAITGGVPLSRRDIL